MCRCPYPLPSLFHLSSLYSSTLVLPSLYLLCPSPWPSPSLSALSFNLALPLSICSVLLPGPSPSLSALSFSLAAHPSSLSGLLYLISHLLPPSSLPTPSLSGSSSASCFALGATDEGLCLHHHRRWCASYHDSPHRGHLSGLVCCGQYVFGRLLGTCSRMWATGIRHVQRLFPCELWITCVRRKIMWLIKDLFEVSVDHHMMCVCDCNYHQ